ncbi:MAG: methyltransferase [Myxococcota bacterium]
MHVGPKPDNLLELLALKAGAVPRPVMDTLLALGLARTVMAGTRLGILEALRDGPRTAAEVAARCETDPRATEKLLGALVGCDYVRHRGGRFSLAPEARRWLVEGGRSSLRDMVLGMEQVWDWLEHYETFVRTGEPLDVHGTTDPDGWATYQRSMRSLAGLIAPEVARRTPVPRGATSLLDVGGSHGYLSVALCRRHPRLSAVVLDLPEAVEHAAPLLAREGLGHRVRHRADDARTADLGEAEHDVILVSSLVHHFTEAENRDLCRRAARALKPGGVLVLQEVIRPAEPGEGGQAGALGDLYFAALSASGTWSFDEMAAWQRDAGLTPRRPLRLLTGPGVGQQSAIRPR